MSTPAQDPAGIPEIPKAPGRTESRDPRPAENLEALAGALAAGEPDALGAWYEAERAPVYRLCLGLLAHVHDAEDAAQEALLRLHDRIDRRDPARAYVPWRNSVVLNLCRDRLRRDRRRSERELAAADAGRAVLPDPADEAAAGECADALAGALAGLPPREREALVLVDLAGRPANEAAETLGVAPSTLRAALSLARRRLEERIGDLLPPRFARGGGAR